MYCLTQKRPELRLIISSGTMDAEELKSYFTLAKGVSAAPKQSSLYLPGIPFVMNVVGRCYPVDIFYVQGTEV